MPVASLPTETWLHVISFLPYTNPKALHALTLTCRRISELANDRLYRFLVYPSTELQRIAKLADLLASNPKRAKAVYSIRREYADDHGAAAARMRERWPGAAWAETVARRIEQSRGDV